MLKNYLKIALKGLMRRKYFTAVSLFGIIITLAVLTVSVAMLNQMSRMGEPGSRLDHCLIANRVEATFDRGHIITSPSYYMLDKYVRNLKTPAAISIFSSGGQIVAYAGDKRVPLDMKHTDAAFWDIAEFPFLEGRPYNKEGLDRADMVAVITDRAAQKIFGHDPISGKYLETSKGTYRIVGLIPHNKIAASFLNADIFTPVTTSKDDLNNQEIWGDASALVQAADKSQFPAIRREFQDHMDQVMKDNKDKYKLETFSCFIGTMGESVSNQANQSELVYLVGIIGVMILFMLLPAVNLTVISISRIMERHSEIGVRKAFGASSITLMGQFIIENVILTLIGGAVAFLLSAAVIKIINDSGIVPWGYIEMDLAVVYYGMIITVFFGIFSGILPSYRMSRLHPAEALKGVAR